MKIMKQLIVAFIALFLVQSSLQASHVAGGNITYECLGNNEYKLYLNLYRDCSSSLMISPPNPSQFTVSNDCAIGNPFINNWQLDTIMEVSNLCQSQLPNSTCNGGSLPGYQQFIFSATVTLPAACDCWTFAYQLCCRNPNSNFQNPQSEYFRIETELCNGVNDCNNSPIFVNPYPLPYYCQGGTYNFSLGAYDLDGDSLYYSFVNTLGINGNNVTYAPGYTAGSPIPGITIDSLSGLVTFTAANTGVYAVTILIEEYDDNGNLLGTYYHDMQIVVQPCPGNSVPGEVGGGCSIDPNVGSSATLIDPGTIEICEDDDFCFSLDFADADPGDSLYITSNIQAVFPGTTINYDYGGTSNQVTVTVCGTIPVSGPSNYYIIFNMIDNFCPFPNTNTYLVVINTVPSTSASDDVTICQGDSTQLNAEGGNIFTWTSIAGDPINVGTNISCDVCEDPIVNPSVTTTYVVTSDISSTACDNVDTVTVFVAPDFDTQGYTLNVNCVSTNILLDSITQDNGFYTYEWSPATYLDDPTLANPTANFGPQGTYEYVVTATNAGGCEKTDTVTVVVGANQQPEVNIIGDDQTICVGSTVNGPGILEGQIDGGAGNVNDYNWTWTPSTGLTSPNSNVTDASPSITTTYVLTAQSLVGNCQDSDTVTIHVVDVEIIVSDTQHVSCAGFSDGGFFLNTQVALPNMINETIDSIVISSPTGQDQVLTNPNQLNSISNLNAGFWTITVYTESGCSFDETIQINEPNPIVTNLMAGAPSCNEMNNWDGSVNANISGGNPSYSVNWYQQTTSSPSIGNNNQITSLAPGDYIINVEDASGCQHLDTVTIIAPDPITVDDSIVHVTCPGDENGAIYITNIQNTVGTVNFNWVPNGETTQNLVNIPGGNYSLTITDQNGCVATYNYTVPAPSPIVLANTSVQDSDCFPGSNGNGQVSAQVTGGWTGNFTYNWYALDDSTMNSTNPTWGNRPPGDYVLVVTDDSSCVKVDTFTVGEKPVIAEIIADPTAGVQPLEVNFTNNSSTGPNFTYIWDFDNSNGWVTQDPDTIVTEIYNEGNYTVSLIVANGNGCYDTAYVDIEVIAALMVKPPNVFTPNGDGANDEFRIETAGVDQFYCRIYDRWGKDVFIWEDHTKGWTGIRMNGKEAAEGVYFYTYEIKGLDGKTFSGQGSVTLKR